MSNLSKSSLLQCKNEEWDVMELMFKFDENGLVSFIYLAAGT